MSQLRKEYILYLYLVRFILAQNSRYESEVRLHRNLLTEYNKNVMPLQNNKNATTISVNVMYYFLSMREFDDKTGHLSICGSFQFYWKDNNLKWNTTQNDDIEVIHLRKNTIWTPTLALLNPYYGYQEVDQNQEDELAYVTSSGVILISSITVLDATCQADVTYFPFDNQVCQLKMSSWYYTDSELRFELASEGNVNQEFAVEHGLFKTFDWKN